MFAVVGLSHHTAPIEVRERIALDQEKVEALLMELVAQPEVAEALIVSTCNRVEVLASARPGVQAESLARCIEVQLSRYATELAPHLYKHLERSALTHIFRVASSLDSLVVGEPQILGQLKNALKLAHEIKAVGPSLRRVTTHAVRTAKRVRSETALGVGQVSVPSVAVDLTRRIFGDLKGRKAALLGLGEMGQLVAKQLGSEGAQLFALGRNPAKVQAIAQELGAEPRSLEQLEQTLMEVDVLIAMTGATHHVIDRDMVARLRRKRRGRSLFFVDLSVPRNIDPAVDSLDDVFLYNIDHLSQIVLQTKSNRHGEADRAEQIVREETENFQRAASAEQVTPMIVALRRSLREVLRSEHDKSKRGKLRELSADHHDAIERMMDAAVNKILHTPTMRLRQAATDSGEGNQLDALVSTLVELFDLIGEDGAPTLTDSLSPPRQTHPSARPSAVDSSSSGPHSARKPQ